MTRVRFDLQSPLTLLRNWDRGALREVLITGYTLDLVFFERHCVPLARSLGARVTILSDAHQSVHDAADVRYAGRTYQHGHVGCRGAFHPKLAVLVGDDDVWIAIGSGNPTTSGWGHNDELWLVIRASRGSGPAALRELAEWLHELPASVSIPSWIAETVHDIADAVDPSDIDGSLPDLRIAGNLDRPLVERIPRAPVHSLRVSAPFLDRASAAVAELVARTTPQQLVVALQERVAWYDGASLVESTKGIPDVEFRFLDDARTSHGKLVEWEDESGTTAMVGSANLTRAALLTSTREGGNCELVAIHPVAQSLLPEGCDAPVTADEMRGRSTIPASSEGDRTFSVVLLGARWRNEAIVVELLVRAAASITIETSPTGAPGSWRPVHRVDVAQPGFAETSFVADEGTGGAVRARTGAHENDVSSVVFLTDVIRCRPRDVADDGPRISRDYSLEDFVTDSVLAERMSNDLIRLMRTVGQHRAANTARVSPTPRPSGSTPEEDRWGAWLDKVQRTLGPTFAGLVFPGAAKTIRSDVDPAVQWTVNDDEPVTDITDDETDEDIDPIADALGDRQPPSIASEHRAAWRTRSDRLRRAAISKNPRPPLELRMSVARIFIDLLAAGVWEADDVTWRSPLADVLTALPPGPVDEEVPETPLNYLGSMIAVGLAVLGQGTRLDGGSPEDVLWQSTWKPLRRWVPQALPEIVDEYLYVPTQTYARVADRESVESLIELARSAETDPNAETRAALESKGLPAEFRDGVWILESRSGAPRKIAAQIATKVGDPCAVIVVCPGRTCAVLRADRTLVMAESHPAKWHVMALRSSVSTPTSLLAGSDGLPSGRKMVDLDSPTQQIVEVAQKLGVDLTLFTQAVRHWRLT